ncbi:MAG TPA: DNA topoisomerase IB, partial [Candidatus Binatia bacterium]|nr:DNA topoisomerase IB [Candidatus Binatia bacterium]
LRDALDEDDPTPTKRRLKAAIAAVAERLGNTVTICRKCYIHPAIIDGYLSGNLAADIRRARRPVRDEPASGLKPEEALTLALLDGRPKGRTGLKERLRQSLEAMP